LFIYCRREKLCSWNKRNEMKQPKKNGYKIKGKRSFSLSLSLSLSLCLTVCLYHPVWMSCLVVKMTGVHSEIAGQEDCPERSFIATSALLSSTDPITDRLPVGIVNRQRTMRLKCNLLSFCASRNSRASPFCCHLRYCRRITDLRTLYIKYPHF